jgi:NAD(P)-dependent dehydrogenase (short-subunit alcohol dehydrogenase family)
MVEGGRGGVIINISSISRAGNIGQTNYAAAKAGVAAMTVTWAKELARYKIRVAGIAPGFCDTRMVANIKPEIREKIISTIPLRRLGEPKEIGGTEGTKNGQTRNRAVHPACTAISTFDGQPEIGAGDRARRHRAGPFET